MAVDETGVDELAINQHTILEQSTPDYRCDSTDRNLHPILVPSLQKYMAPVGSEFITVMNSGALD